MGLARGRQGSADCGIEPIGRVIAQVTSKRTVLAAIAMIITVGLVVGVVTGSFASLARAGLYATGLWSSNGPSVLPSASPDAPTPSASRALARPTPSATTSPPVDLPAGVLVGADSGDRPNPAKVRARIAKVRVKNSQGRLSGSVLEVTSGSAVFRQQAGRALIPASTMKLLTSATVLSLLGPDHTFTTSVVSPKRGQLILVGGGDPYLMTKRSTASSYPKRASVAGLAKSTATELRKAKISRVRLGYDAGLFGGPAWNPTWPSGYGDQVSRISALWVDGGRTGGGSPGPRASDPARAATNAYAAALRKQGIRVVVTGRASAPRTAARVASVSSMPLERIVEQVLMVSDNDAAEVLFRHVAVAKQRRGTSAEASRAVRAELTELGLWRDGTVIADGSGLSRQNRIPAEVLARTLRLAAGDDRPRLRGVITGLSVAGVEGSLRRRYFDDESLPGRGVVRGKTGTLREVHTLAGLLRTRDGSVLVYAFLINNPKNQFAARVWLDRVTAALSTCGCR